MGVDSTILKSDLCFVFQNLTFWANMLRNPKPAVQKFIWHQNLHIVDVGTFNFPIARSNIASGKKLFCFLGHYVGHYVQLAWLMIVNGYDGHSFHGNWRAWSNVSMVYIMMSMGFWSQTFAILELCSQLKLRTKMKNIFWGFGLLLCQLFAKWGTSFLFSEVSKLECIKKYYYVCQWPMFMIWKDLINKINLWYGRIWLTKLMIFWVKEGFD